MYASTISVYWFNKTVVNLNRNVSLLSQNNTPNFQECLILEPIWAINDTNIYKFQNKLNWKKKHFATALFVPPRRAAVCVWEMYTFSPCKTSSPRHCHFLHAWRQKMDVQHSARLWLNSQRFLHLQSSWQSIPTAPLLWEKILMYRALQKGVGLKKI